MIKMALWQLSVDFLFHGYFRNVAENRFFTVYVTIVDNWLARIKEALEQHYVVFLSWN